MNRIIGAAGLALAAMLAVAAPASAQDNPLAALSDFELAELHSKKRNVAAEAEIVRRKKDPALLEYVGYGLYRTSVFPLPPGQERRVIVNYGEGTWDEVVGLACLIATRVRSRFGVQLYAEPSCC